MGSEERVIVPLDYSSKLEATPVANEISKLGGTLKVGLQLFLSEGRDLVKLYQRWSSGRVFLDLKFHDIPRTMAAAARSASDLDVWAFSVHASAGPDGIQAACENKGRSLVLASTILTSFDQKTCHNIYGKLNVSLAAAVLSQIAVEAGVDGIICSPHEARTVRPIIGNDKLIVTPGIRFRDSPPKDQFRISTPAEAIKATATHIVMGDPITHSQTHTTKEAFLMAASEVESAMRS